MSDKLSLTAAEAADRIIAGGEIAAAEALHLLKNAPREELREAAHRVTEALVPKKFDFCAIINARSGKCSENCKWCAQSAHYHTGCETYGWVGADKCVKAAKDAEAQGANRFGIVTSGRCQSNDSVDEICGALRRLSNETKIHLCGSLGLVSEEDLRKLKDAGLERYHCNLETAPSFFSSLCTTHTTEQKLVSIRAAKKLGLEVCCGGIIGMGETDEQLVEFAYAVKEVAPESIPINVLHPIPGTPLGDRGILDPERVIDSVAIIRLVNPRTPLRFAGGRRDMSDEVAAKTIYCGMSAGIAGPLLTTPGAVYADDRHLAQLAGYDVSPTLRDAPKWVYERANFRRPDVQLEHVNATIRFFEDRVCAEARLTLTARKPMSEVELDFQGGKIKKPIGREVAAGETFEIDVDNTFNPSDTNFYGIYRDTTPPGCPQQYMSQCQQFGFQLILPIVDDCTAKCTFRTVLEGDAAYTHLISNGDLVETSEWMDPSGESRKRCVYENNQRMAPYLFIAAAGTWDALTDEVEYPDTHQKIGLEYLVPPGRIEGARIPMAILKDSILWQHQHLGYSYPYRKYRTITMEKSLYGGMENTGNTTIITEAALIDETIGDRRLVYAHGVIPHEYEHSHCGSGVTMESVFDMWLNEAFTVNVERAYLAKIFGSAFSRAGELEDLRATGGAFAADESGIASPVVREGVNDPDEVVDAITYDKAPEVLNTLRALIGEEKYRAAWREYFHRFNGGNANTGNFLEVFTEVTGRDIRALIGNYLFKPGYPVVHARWGWTDGKLDLSCSVKEDFTVPVAWAAVKGGRIAAEGMIVHDPAKGADTTATVELVERPDFISWNAGGQFYGVLIDESATAATLALQAKSDPDEVNRVRAIRTLSDRARIALADGGDDLRAWSDLHVEIFNDEATPLNLKAELLRIPDDPDDRRMCLRVERNWKDAKDLRLEVARRLGVDAIAASLEKSAAASRGLEMAPAIIARRYENDLLQLLSDLNEERAWTAIEGYLASAKNITARLNALRALTATDDPRRAEILERHGVELRKSLNGYTGYLSVVATDPHETVFESIVREENREGWSIKHPAYSRALYCGMAGNDERLWTDRGLEWIGDTIVKYAQVGEYNALRVLASLENYRGFEPSLSAKVRAVLEKIRAALPAEKFPAISGKLVRLLAD